MYSSLVSLKVNETEIFSSSKDFKLLITSKPQDRVSVGFNVADKPCNKNIISISRYVDSTHKLLQSEFPVHDTREEIQRGKCPIDSCSCGKRPLHTAYPTGHAQERI